MNEMQIQHPTAIMISRTARAQDDITGDGTTSSVLFIGELLKMAERYLSDGLHPRIITDGFDLAKDRALLFLEQFKVQQPRIALDRDLLVSIARTSLRTKLHQELADQLTEIVTDAVLCVRRPENEDLKIDLHMVEILHMIHRYDSDTRLIRGMVLDHGARHPDMPKYLENCFILTCNVSLEYEKSEVASGMFYKSAEERERMVSAERRFTDEKVRQVIALKDSVCTEENGRSLVLINEKGIDAVSLDMLAKAGIIGIRRAKRRNMERLTRCCGGFQVNSFDDVTCDALGFAGKVYEQTLGDEKYTFIEDVENPSSCAILVKGPNEHTISQIKGAIRDGLRNIKNAIEDGSVVPGAGAFELACHAHLMEYKDSVRGRAKLGVQAFADALLVVPKTLAENSGFDVLDTLVRLQEERSRTGAPVGLDLLTGLPILPVQHGIWDNTCVKRQSLHLCPVIATQLLLVDEVMKAGKNMGGKQG